MHTRAILALVVVVGLLWAATRVNQGIESEELERIEAMEARRDLLAGVTSEDASYMSRVRIDNLERSVQVTLARGGDGAWSLVDPIAWPAEPAVLQHLFDTLQQDRGQPSPDVDPADVGLDPPRALCELTFTRPGATPEVHLLEVGSPDLDHLRLFVAVTGPDGERRVLRANRSLETLFQRFVDDYRSRAILALDPASVVEVRRTGPATLPAPGGPAGGVGPVADELPNPLLPPDPFPTLDLVVRQGPRGWEALEPYRGALDPQAAAMLVLTLSRLEATGFHAETAADPAAFGFDRPELELAIVTDDQRVHRLAFARPGWARRDHAEGRAAAEDQAWLCRLEGRETVFEVDPRRVLLSAGPPDAFVDARLVRGAPDQVRGATYAAGGREVRLTRAGQGPDATWTVSGPTAGGAVLDGRAADPERVDEFLQALRAVELLELVPGGALAPTLVPTFVRVDVAGELRGGDLGPLSGGAEGTGFRRLDEELVATVDPSVPELLATPPEDFLDRRLLEVDELRLAWVELAVGEVTRRFERDPRRGIWSEAGAEGEARAFANQVDRLRSLRALSYTFPAAGATLPPLADPVTVTLDLPAESGPRGLSAERITYRVAAGPDGTELLELEGLRALVYPGLRAALGELLAP